MGELENNMGKYGNEKGLDRKINEYEYLHHYERYTVATIQDVIDCLGLIHDLSQEQKATLSNDELIEILEGLHDLADEYKNDPKAQLIPSEIELLVSLYTLLNKTSSVRSELVHGFRIHDLSKYN